jgi:hypothetical protein
VSNKPGARLTAPGARLAPAANVLLVTAPVHRGIVDAHDFIGATDGRVAEVAAIFR